MLLRFLLVDDEPLITTALGRVLERAYPTADVRAARANDEAYDILRKFSADLIITDLRRPEASGEEFIAALRKDPHTREVPIIVASAWAANLKADELVQLGADAILVKPFLLSELLHVVERFLHTRTDPDVRLIRLGFETRELDYKAQVDLESTAGRASIAKDLIAMGNWGGGNIVVGVDEPSPGEFRPVGISGGFEKFETSRFNRAVRSFMDPPIAVVVRRVQHEGMTFIILEVPGAVSTLVLVARKNEAAKLYPGRIYSRSSAAESAEVQTSAELRQLLDRIMSRSGRSPGI